jgi:hypothetical protein
VSRLALAALLLVPALAHGTPLPRQGPPPDPSRGETFDGRERDRESTAREVALAAPRVLLAPIRALARVTEGPALRATKLVERADALDFAFLRLARPPLVLSPVVILSLDHLPAVGLKLRIGDIFGPNRAVLTMTGYTAGPRLAVGRISLTPNPALPLAIGARAQAFWRKDAPFYLESDDKLRFSVLALDAEVQVTGRLGRAFRLGVKGGAGTRSFGPGISGPPVEPMTLQGFDDGAQFVTGAVFVERNGFYDPLRRKASLDLRLGGGPTIGLGDDESRYLTMAGRATLGIPIGHRRSLLVSGLVGDQESFGDEEINFYDRFALGGRALHRGFPTWRFRGNSVLLASVDHLMPISRSAFLDFFADYGGVFGEHFGGFNTDELHTSLGAGVYLGQEGGAHITLAYGVGEGLMFSLAFGPPGAGIGPAALP